jgi:hypothetical protein
VKALGAQVARLIHASNLYRISEAEAASDRLAALSSMDEVFFCNSGCEANEAAIKLARMFGHQQGVEQPAIVVMEHAFHGRTLATLSATGNRKVQAGFEPLVSGFVRVPFDDLAAIEQLAERNPNIVAVLFEPIQGEGGINLAHRDFMRSLRQICDRKNWLFMVDEVQCGIGAHRGLVRPPACRHRARCDDVGQGPRFRRADRCLPGRRARCRRVQAGQPRLHLRRQSAGLRGCLDHDRRHRIRRAHGACGEPRRVHPRRLAPGAGR